MIKHFIIDGNNLIGYNPKLKKIQKVEGQKAREDLVVLLQKYFFNKKVSVNLYLDGYEKEKINSGKLKIIYSQNKTADDLIREEITLSKNKKSLCLVSSDNPLSEFAKKNSCSIKKSDDFWKEFYTKPIVTEKEDYQKIISNSEMLKLFGIK